MSGADGVLAADTEHMVQTHRQRAVLNSDGCSPQRGRGPVQMGAHLSGDEGHPSAGAAPVTPYFLRGMLGIQVSLYSSHFLKCIYHIFIYLAVPGLCLWHILWHVGSSSLTRDRTQAPALGVWSLKCWTMREVPFTFFNTSNNSFFFFFYKKDIK